MGSPMGGVEDEGHYGRVLPMMASPMIGLGTADDRAVDNSVAKDVVVDANDEAAKMGVSKNLHHVQCVLHRTASQRMSLQTMTSLAMEPQTMGDTDNGVDRGSADDGYRWWIRSGRRRPGSG